MTEPFEIVIPFTFNVTKGADFTCPKPGEYTYSFKIDEYTASRYNTPEIMLTLLIKSLAYKIKDEIFIKEDE